MRLRTQILFVIFSLLTTMMYVQTALAVYGSIDLLPVMNKSVDEGKDIIIDIISERGKLIGLANFNEDDNVWYFDFPDRKTRYVARWKGGSANLVSPFMSDTETIIAGGTVLTAIIAGAIAITSSSSSSSSKPSGIAGVPSCSEINGLYSVSGPRTSDTCSSTTEIFTGSSQVQCQNGSLTIQSRTLLSGSYNDSGTVSASGSGSMNPQPFDTGGSGQVLLTVFKESFNGTASSQPGDIVLNGALLFEYSEHSGGSIVCQTQYDAAFIKQ